jgi:hypothetical protein
MTTLADADLIASARRWANIYDLALRQLSLAMEDPYRDVEIVALLNRAAADAQDMMDRRLKDLSRLGLAEIARNIRETRGSAPEPAVPLAFRLAEAPIGQEGVAVG